MAQYTQKGRPLRVDTALGADVLLLDQCTGAEEVSKPFRFTLQMVSTESTIAPDDILNTPATITIMDSDGVERIIHGRINTFTQLERGPDGLTAYRADLVPWLWFLSLSHDCRIFQQLSTLDIVEKVFRDAGYSDFQSKCVKSYAKREYCVQYRETNLDFVSRLLEEDGIFYFFEHSSEKHTLILADGPNAVKDCPGRASLRVAPSAGVTAISEPVVVQLQTEYAVATQKAALTDYNPETPTANLHVSATGSGPHEVRVGEMYDYPGDYASPDEGERLNTLRLDMLGARQRVVRGWSTSAALTSGYKFVLTEHSVRDVNQAYHLLRVEHWATSGGYHAEGGNFRYQNSFTGIPSDVPYRPPLVTPKPIVHGSQTAVVVGQAGEEIWVDKYGRVKVQFFWDREGQKNDASSCWVRVATTWAGKGWGAIQIPRIGQEVIIDFLEGDPDHPIITGRVYNAEQMPPWELPANQTWSGVKTRSTKGGGTSNFNELRFEDKKGSEEVLLHAERVLRTEVEADEIRDVGHDRTTTIQNNDTKTVKKGDDAVTVEKGDQTIEITEGSQKTHLGQGSQFVNIDQGQHKMVLQQGDCTIVLNTGNLVHNIELGKVETEAMQSIELKVGSSSIKIDQMGVTIQGMQVKIEGQIQTEVKGAITQVNGDGMLQMKGGITMIN